LKDHGYKTEDLMAPDLREKNKIAY